MKPGETLWLQEIKEALHQPRHELPSYSECIAKHIG